MIVLYCCSATGTLVAINAPASIKEKRRMRIGSVYKVHHTSMDTPSALWSEHSSGTISHRDWAWSLPS